MRRRRTRSILVGFVLLGSLTTTGCTVSIIDPSADDAPTPAPAASDAQVERSTPTPRPTTEAPMESSGLSAEGQADRDRLIAAASTTAACPTGPITADGAVIRIEGSCPDLVVEADAAVVVADDVQRLVLSGDGTVVYVETVDAVSVSGSASSVFWAGATPSVNDTGTANTLRRG